MKRAPVVSVLIAAVPMLVACGGSIGNRPEDLFAFSEQSMNRIDIAAAPARVCEAAKNVLMGEGYVVAPAADDEPLALVGTREFMAEKDRPAVAQLYAVCRESATGAVLFATVVESHFTVSETKHKTAVGIPIVAPISVSTTATSADLLKVSGQTLRDANVYRRFFSAVLREMSPGK